MSPTQRTLQELRKRGLTAAVVERWNPHAKIRQDLFGFIDVLAVGDDGVIAVQTTSNDHVSDRLKKVLAHDNYKPVTAAGIKVYVHGWMKSRSTGRWTLREIDCSKETQSAEA